MKQFKSHEWIVTRNWQVVISVRRLDVTSAMDVTSLYRIGHVQLLC